MRWGTLIFVASIVAAVAFTIRWKAPGPEAHLRQGNLFARGGQFPAAIEEYTRAVELKPGYTEAYRKRAIAHMNLTEYRQAIADLDRVVRHDPGQAGAYYDRAISYHFLGEPERVCRDMAEACRLGLEDGCTQHRLGGC